MTSRKKVAFDFVREAMAGSAVAQEALVAGSAVAGSAVAGSAAAGLAAAAALAEAHSERTRSRKISMSLFTRYGSLAQLPTSPGERAHVALW